MSAEPAAVLAAGPFPGGSAAPLSVVSAMRRIPATLVYLAVLGVMAAVVPQLGTATAEQLIQAASTNLDNLRSGSVSTLLTSAFVITEPPSMTSWILLAAVMTAAELVWGTWRAVAVFFAGHVGATLVVAAGLAIAISHGWTSPAVASAADVGISYGLMCLVGAVTAVLPAAIRPAWALAWLAGSAGSVALTGGFTSVGHLCALVIGLAIAVGVRLKARRSAAGAPAGPAPADPAPADPAPTMSRITP